VALAQDREDASDVAVLKVSETLTFPGGEYHLDHPTIPVTDFDTGEVVIKPTQGLPGVVGWAAGQIVFDTLNPVLNNQQIFDKQTAFLYQGLEERTVNLAPADFPSLLLPANKRTQVKNGKYVLVEAPSSLQKRIFYDPISGKLGIKGFLNDKSIGDSTLTASPPSHSPVPLISFSDNVTPTYTQGPRLSQQLVCMYLEPPSCLGIALINVPLSSLLFFFFHLRRSCKVKTATMVNGK